MKYLFLRLVIPIMVYAVVPAAVIFGLAGRWDLWNIWAYVGIIVILYSLQTIVLYLKIPELVKEQVQPSGPELKGRSFRVVRVQLMTLLVFIIAGLDQRLHGSDMVPPADVVAGLVIVALGLGIYTWAMLINAFFSASGRIQKDRGQAVISSGPYGVVRHPGYAGLILRWLATPVAFNSLLSILPAVIVAGLVARETAIEDQTLRNELAGYADYAARVRYRLIPGLW